MDRPSSGGGSAPAPLGLGAFLGIPIPTRTGMYDRAFGPRDRRDEVIGALVERRLQPRDVIPAQQHLLSSGSCMNAYDRDCGACTARAGAGTPTPPRPPSSGTR